MTYFSLTSSDPPEALTMEYCAYPLDYTAFMNELAPLLEAALPTADTAALASFIQANLGALKNPYEPSKRLDSAWHDALLDGSVSEYGDFALTKYYDLFQNMGSWLEWPELDDILEQFGLPDLLYGETVGKGLTKFDPSQEGTFFQSPIQVKENLHLLENLACEQPQIADKLSALIAMFRQVAESGDGLYISLS